MGNFFKEVRKLFAQLEGVKNYPLSIRGKNILSILAHQPVKDVRYIKKRLSFVEKDHIHLTEAGFRIHIKDKKRTVIDPITGKKEHFFLEIIFNGEDLILRWPTGHRVLNFEELGEDVYKEFDLFLKNLFVNYPPEKESYMRKFVN